MANPRPSNPKKFVKGQIANPLGAGAHNKDLKAVRRLTQQEVADVGGFILNNNLEALKAVQKNPASSVFKVWVCSVAVNAINKGDAHALDVLLNRIVGKVKEDNTVTLNVNKGVESMTEGEASEIIKAAQSKLG